jgi:multiple sugar transport system substrate-binding protein
MISTRTRWKTLGSMAVVGALAVALAGCSGGTSGDTSSSAAIPAKGTDDGTKLTMWSRAPLEKQATNAVD